MSSTVAPSVQVLSVYVVMVPVHDALHVHAEHDRLSENS
jgi:hypothetical protein